MKTLDTRGRGAGKTYEMIQQIPEEGCIVLFAPHTLMRWIREQIANLRNEDILKKCQFRCVNTIEDIHMLRGYSSKILADHSVWENPKMSYATGWHLHQFLMQQEQKR